MKYSWILKHSFRGTGSSILADLYFVSLHFESKHGGYLISLVSSYVSCSSTNYRSRYLVFFLSAIAQNQLESVVGCV